MNAAPPLLSVAEALARVLASAPRRFEHELVDISEACGRVLAQDLRAVGTQPSCAVSAMDGYAARAADIAKAEASLDVIGVSVAGASFGGEVKEGQAVRIFTGAAMPTGSDTVVIQENVTRAQDRVTIHQSEPVGRNVRPAGLDFKEGDLLLVRGRRLGPVELSLAAAMNHAQAPVTRKPRVALLATGDELAPPGSPLGPNQIVASSAFAVAAYAKAAGAETIDLGIAKDNLEALKTAIDAVRRVRADVLVTLGGASVGDHDLVQSALAREGMALSFWRIALRPGKPLMHGELGALRVLGLPGNPVSSIVCAILFLVPLVRALSGDRDAAADASEPAILGANVRANDDRQDYLRAALSRGPGGEWVATPFKRQDSSMLSTLAEARALVIRAPHASAARAGDSCAIIRI